MTLMLLIVIFNQYTILFAILVPYDAPMRSNIRSTIDEIFFLLGVGLIYAFTYDHWSKEFRFQLSMVIIVLLSLTFVPGIIIYYAIAIRTLI